MHSNLCTFKWANCWNPFGNWNWLSLLPIQTLYLRVAFKTSAIHFRVSSGNKLGYNLENHSQHVNEWMFEWSREASCQKNGLAFKSKRNRWVELSVLKSFGVPSLLLFFPITPSTFSWFFKKWDILVSYYIIQQPLYFLPHVFLMCSYPTPSPLTCAHERTVEGWISSLGFSTKRIKYASCNS